MTQLPVGSTNNNGTILLTAELLKTLVRSKHEYARTQSYCSEVDLPNNFGKLARMRAGHTNAAFLAWLEAQGPRPTKFLAPENFGSMAAMEKEKALLERSQLFYIALLKNIKLAAADDDTYLRLAVVLVEVMTSRGPLLAYNLKKKGALPIAISQPHADLLTSSAHLLETPHPEEHRDLTQFTALDFIRWH